MFHNSMSVHRWWFVMLLFALACSSDEPEVLSEQPNAMPNVDTPVETPEETPHTLVPSRRPSVKFKGAQRYGTDLMNALFLSKDSLCNELGQYPCLNVHNIVLGGVEPYRLGINKPLERASATAPIAVERVALQACIRRADLDFAEGAQSLFFEVLPENMSAPESTWLRRTAGRMYELILRRTGESHELDVLANLFETVSAEYPDSAQEALRQWQVLSCFALATSLEALFY